MRSFKVLARPKLLSLSLLTLLSLQAALSWGAAPPPTGVPAAGPAAVAPLISPLSALGPGDSVTLHVFGQPDMDTVLAVSDDGTVRVPLAGSIQVGGLSADAAARRVEGALKDGGFLIDPHVTLTVTASLSQRVSVFGEVRNPGRYPVDSKTTVVDLLAEAGGLTEFGSNTVYVLRPDAGGDVKRYPVSLKGLSDPHRATPTQLLRAGDSLVVPRAEQFYIMGEVNKPDKYKLEPDMTVMQAISLAGGLTPRGTYRRVEIKRTGKNGAEVISPKADDFVLPDDVIRVKESIF
jgi:polysaccharide export outer membrane protein